MSLSTPEILQRLKSQDLHLGMLYDRSLAGDEYDVLPLFAERYVLVAGEQASLPHELGWAEVAGLPLCLLSRDMPPDAGRDIQGRGRDATCRAGDQRHARPARGMPERAGVQRLAAKRLPTYPEGGGLRIYPITPEHAEDVCLARLRRETQPVLSQAAWRIASNLDLEAILSRALADPA